MQPNIHTPCPVPFYMADTDNSPSRSLSSSVSSHQQAASALLKGKRVVVVEDEGITLMHLRKICTLVGMQVVGTAADGEQGVVKVLEAQPDIVLMDINMPLLDGFGAAERILKELQVCVVMLTAYDLEEYQQRAQELGVSGYILKPVTASILVPQLEAAYEQFLMTPDTQEK